MLYDTIGKGYRAYRRPDARIAQRIRDALGPCRSVLNVGAGAGSYEPADLQVVAAEPSREMLAQRPPNAAVAVQALAERLPFGDGAFDASMAVLTMHHWSDQAAGLAEMRRVARERVVLLTWDPAHEGFWLHHDYFPEVLDMDLIGFPSIEELSRMLGGAEVRVVPVPHDCTDGFLGAYWRRPERYLEPGARHAISAFARLKDVETRIEALRRDLDSGRWAERHSHLRDLAELDLGYRLLVARTA